MTTYSVQVDGVVLGTLTSSRRLTHAVVARLAPHLTPKRRMVVLCFTASRAQAVREAQVVWTSRVYREATVVPATVQPSDGQIPTGRVIDARPGELGRARECGPRAPHRVPRHKAVGVQIRERLPVGPRDRHDQLPREQWFVTRVAASTDAGPAVNDRRAGLGQVAGPELLDNEHLKLPRRATLCLSFKQTANFRASERVPLDGALGLAEEDCDPIDMTAQVNE